MRTKPTQETSTTMRKTFLVTSVELPAPQGQKGPVLKFKGFTFDDKAELTTFAAGVVDRMSEMARRIASQRQVDLPKDDQEMLQFMIDSGVSAVAMFESLLGDKQKREKILGIFRERCFAVEGWEIDGKPVKPNEAFQFLDINDFIFLVMYFNPSNAQKQEQEKNLDSPSQSSTSQNSSKNSTAADVINIRTSENSETATT